MAQLLKVKTTKTKKRSNGVAKLSLESLTFPKYVEIKAQIEKKIGTLPIIPSTLPKGDWSEQALKVLEERYLVKNAQGEVIETPEDMCWRVAWEISSAEALWGKDRKEVMEQAKDFYRLLISREFLPNSPTLMNAGTGNMLQYSACFVLPVEDSMEGIFDALKYQALIHKSGGGTGFAFSRLRPKGAMVKSSSGTASGPVSFMRIFDAATNEVKQGGKRRGANMGILRVDHPDILEFIHCKDDNGGISNFNISVALTDKFMEAYKAKGDYDLIDPHTNEKVGSLNAEKVFDEIAESAWKSGDPGLIFVDKINNSVANPVPALGPVESTNPCVVGDTRVSTKDGLVKIRDLVGKRTEILVDGRFNKGSHAIPLRIMETGVKEVFRLETAEGYSLRLTKDHQVMTSKGWKRAQDLNKDDILHISNIPGAFGREGTKQEGEILGWLVGDGTLKASSAVLSFFGSEKAELAPYFSQEVSHLVDGMQQLNRAYPVGVRSIPSRDEARVESTRLFRYAYKNGIAPGEKLIVPERVFQGSKNMQAGFLSALFTADGHVSGTRQKGVSVRLTSISYKLLQDVQLLLLNFGIKSTIYKDRRTEGKRLLPDGHGGSRDYNCKAYHDLAISKSGLWLFAKEIAFLSEAKNRKLIDLLKGYKEGPYAQYFVARFRKLISEGMEEVFDLTEPSTSSFVANGLVVHNCGEQPLYPFDSCNLGSIFLSYFVKAKDGEKYIDWEHLREIARKATRFMDNVIEMNPYPLEQIRQTSLGIRRIGLGVGGWADMLVELGIAYDSNEALELGEEVMRVIQEEAVNTSRQLAKERGAFPLFPLSVYKDEAPRRNSTVTTIAPTGTISIIAGTSSGVEPLFAIAYQHIVKDKHLSRVLTFVNPKFRQIAEERGVWNEELEKKIGEHGTVRDIEDLPADLRKIFGTAHEIHHDWHIKMQAAFQKYTENAVSKTINMRHEVGSDEIRQSYLLAWETECKGITVFRDGCKDAQVLNLGVKNDEKPEVKTVEPISDEATLERPFRVIGATYKLNTPVGTAFVTINEDTVGEPIEVFINVGKAGSDLTAVAEALGRTISTALRFRGSLTRREKALEIAHQLSGIGGRRSVGFGPSKIRSLPDAVASALAHHMGVRANGFAHFPDSNGHSNAAQTILSEIEIQTPVVEPQETAQQTLAFAVGVEEAYHSKADICPSCGAMALVFEEGCSKCHACGHSEC